MRLKQVSFSLDSWLNLLIMSTRGLRFRELERSTDVEDVVEWDLEERAITEEILRLEDIRERREDEVQQEVQQRMRRLHKCKFCNCVVMFSIAIFFGSLILLILGAVELERMQKGECMSMFFVST